MRAVLGAIALYAVAGSGCSAPAGGPVASLRSPIAYGTADTAHTAVVALLSPVGSTELQECSGSVVAVNGSKGVVLTAAHCCNQYPPTLVVLANDYSPGEQYLSGGTPEPPTYPVVAGSVSFDPQYATDDGLDHDFCLLQFSGAPASTATLMLPSATDGLALNDAIDHVGYGQTNTSNTNSTRRIGADTVNLELTSLILEWGQGGGGDTPGTCDGDSGGPALSPSGVAQGRQVVVGVTSYGPADSTCAQETYGVASRVSSAMGAGGFIATYLAAAGTPTGSDGGATPQPASAGGPWAAVALAALLLVAGAGARPRKGIAAAGAST
jgi:hypothetical protein